MKPETQHMIQILRTAMRVLGVTNAEIERRLGVSGGYLTRLFGGVMELRFEHIVDISKAIGMEPQEIFQLAYPHPRNPPTEAAQRIREVLNPLQSEPGAASSQLNAAAAKVDLDQAFDQELERRMRQIFLKLLGGLDKGAAGGE